MSKALDPTVKQMREDIEARTSLLEYQIGQVAKQLERIENKQDAAIRQIDTLKYVSTHEFEEKNKDNDKKYADKDAVRTISKLLYWVLGILASIFLVGLAAFIGLVLKP
jgi:hypothetical protein